MIGYELLKTGTLVSFRVVAEEVLTAPVDDAEFGMRIQLKFVAEDGDEGGEDDVAENTAEWGAFGFMFALGVLSFADAKPRNASVLDYEEKDEFRLAQSCQIHTTDCFRSLPIELLRRTARNSGFSTCSVTHPQYIADETLRRSSHTARRPGSAQHKHPLALKRQSLPYPERW